MNGMKTTHNFILVLDLILIMKFNFDQVHNNSINLRMILMIALD